MRSSRRPQAGRCSPQPATWGGGSGGVKWKCEQMPKIAGKLRCRTQTPQSLSKQRFVHRGHTRHQQAREGGRQRGSAGDRGKSQKTAEHCETAKHRRNSRTSTPRPAPSPPPSVLCPSHTSCVTEQSSPDGVVLDCPATGAPGAIQPGWHGQSYWGLGGAQTWR